MQQALQLAAAGSRQRGNDHTTASCAVVAFARSRWLAASDRAAAQLPPVSSDCRLGSGSCLRLSMLCSATRAAQRAPRPGKEVTIGGARLCSSSHLGHMHGGQVESLGVLVPRRHPTWCTCCPSVLVAAAAHQGRSSWVTVGSCNPAATAGTGSAQPEAGTSMPRKAGEAGSNLHDPAEMAAGRAAYRTCIQAWFKDAQPLSVSDVAQNMVSSVEQAERRGDLQLAHRQQELAGTPTNRWQRTATMQVPHRTVASKLASASGCTATALLLASCNAAALVGAGSRVGW